jgi:hypothetical protein
MRRFLAAALVAASAVTAPAAHAAPVASTVVVHSYSGEQATSFATVPGEPYLVTVTGTFVAQTGYFNFGAQDCGWWYDPAAGPVQRNDLVTLDDHATACGSLPYSETHTYQWTETGTGAPFRFAVSGLLAGALTFTVTGARADVPHTVTSFCFPHGIATSLLDYVPIVVEAGATASEPGSAVSTYVVCDVTGASGESAHVSRGLPGPAVETAERMVVPPGDRLTVCSYAGASWDDGVDVTNPPTCYQTVVA